MIAFDNDLVAGAGYRTIASSISLGAFTQLAGEPEVEDIIAEIVNFFENGAEVCPTMITNGTQCTIASPVLCECDDSNPCTEDICLGSGKCSHVLDTSCTPCTSDADCKDNQACILVDSVCKTIPGKEYAVTPNQGLDTSAGNNTITTNIAINQPNASLKVEEIHLKVTVNHTWRGQIRVRLIAEDGTAQLMQAEKVLDNNDHLFVTYGIGKAPSTESSTFFAGQSLNQTWKVEIKDVVAGDGQSGLIPKIQLFVVDDSIKCTADTFLVDCDDSDACTTPSCESGACAFTATNCDDLDACTDDSCAPATGCANVATVCDDGNVCTTDTCTDPAVGCAFTQIENCTSTCTKHSECGFDDWCDNGTCKPIPGDVEIESTTTPAIPDNDATGVTITMNNPSTNVMKDFKVKVVAAHSFKGDLEITLTNPDGVSLKLKDPVATAAGVGTLYAIYDYDAGAAGADFTKFDATKIKGNWQVKVVDTSGSDIGSITKIKLYFETTQCLNDAHCNDSNACTTDACTLAAGNGTCSNVAVNCDDGLFCNGTESCDTSTGCFNNADAPNPNDNVPCTIDSCQELGGGAGQIVNAPNNLACSDNKFCNGEEVCDQTSGCIPGTAPTQDDGIACTDDGCDEINDTITNTPNHASCANGVFCDGDEICDVAQNGCVAGPIRVIDDQVACTDDSCDEVNDVVVNAPDHAKCQDGLYCNGAEICKLTEGCKAGNAVDVSDGVDCTLDSCDEDTDSIVNTPNDTLCDDNLFCNGAETCHLTQGCLAGTPPVIDDGVDCTADTCDDVADKAVNTPDHSKCDNSLFCDGVEVCDKTNGCTAGTAPLIDDGFDCTADACDEDTDTIVRTPDDSVCDNGQFCDGVEKCLVGLGCVSGTVPNLDDGIACTADACDDATDSITNTPVNSACDDGLFCTGVETCDVALGCQTTPPTLDDGIACTIDACDETADAITNTPDNSKCDDAQFCNGAEICVAGVGCQTQAGSIPVTDDSIPCTVDACDEVTDLVTNTPDNSVCDDGQFCNGPEKCDAVTGCKAGVPVNFDDNIACTTDSCDETADKTVHVIDNALCDDGLFCNGAETCSAVLGCTAGVAPTADDGVACTNPVCDDDADVINQVADDTKCDDGLACNGAETCDATNGCLAGSGVDVNDNIDCTVDTCDATTQAVINTPNNALCDDGLLCTTDLCDAVAGCSNPTAAGWCRIDDTCFATNAVNPADACQVCDPAADAAAWTVKATGTETCNGVDDDCDGLTDEDANGDPLTAPCADACGTAGTQTCDSGSLLACSQQTPKEICGNNNDDDCDGFSDATDPEGCTEPPVAVAGDKAVVKFAPTLGQPDGTPVFDSASSTFTSVIYDLANPNSSGTVTASAYGNTTPSLSYTVGAMPPQLFQVASMRDTLYVDNAQHRAAIIVKDAFDRPVATGTKVTATFTGLDLTAGGLNTVTCNTSAQGICTISWTAPASVFVTGGSVLCTITVGSLPAATRNITITKDAGVLSIAAPGAGFELPKSPLFPGASFSVPCYLNTNGKQASSYDLRLNYDITQLKVTGIVKGGCTAFDTPVSNVAGDANTSGVLKFNATNIDTGNACATGAKVHVATVTFQTLGGITPDVPSGAANLTGTLKDMFDVGLAPITSNRACSTGVRVRPARSRSGPPPSRGSSPGCRTSSC